jgi:CheY-like chemotaxis protein
MKTRMNSDVSKTSQAVSLHGSGAPPARKEILLVDDDKQIRRLLLQILESAGYRVLTASNGVTAIKMYQKQRFDLVIMDLLMPEKGGVETIAEMLQFRPNQRFIAMSGGGRSLTSDFLNSIKPSGIAKTLAKPFSSKTLFKAVKDLLKRVWWGPVSKPV